MLLCNKPIDKYIPTFSRSVVLVWFDSETDFLLTLLNQKLLIAWVIQASDKNNAKNDE